MKSLLAYNTFCTTCQLTCTSHYGIHEATGMGMGWGWQSCPSSYHHIIIIIIITSSANRTPVLGCRRRYSADRESLWRSSEGRLAGSDWCLRRCPIVGDDHGLASILTAENADQAASDDDAGVAAVAAWRSWETEVGDETSGTVSPSSSSCDVHSSCY